MSSVDENHLQKTEQAKEQTRAGDGNTHSVVEARNKIRLARINTVCERENPHLIRRENPMLRAIIDPNRKITYCRVNKVASTYTLKTLTDTFNCSKTCFRETRKDIQQLPYSEFRDVIAGTYKFMFVREPYGRLFSTYSNKFYFTKEHWAPVGPNIITRYRKNPSFESKTYGHNVTFHEMIRFVVEEFEAGRKNIDEHLRPMYMHCDPCDYSYDFIGNLETMESDWAYLRDIWHTRRKIAKLSDTVGKNLRDDITGWVHVKRTIERFKKSTISQYKLYLRAWTYYQITGLVCKTIALPFTEDSNISIYKFQEALLKAVEQSKPFADECKRQKKEALHQAYASVPLELLERLKNALEIDCYLFGYETRPDWVFIRENTTSDFNYFKGLA
ncbi:hypothetical protein ACF0H5_001741 [Mactra antiquata]